MTTTTETIREQRESIATEILRLRGLIEIEQAKLKALQRQCKHPNLKTYRDITQVSCQYCEDCGYER